MYDGKMVFSQVMALLPWRRFQTCVERYRGDYKVISLTTQEFFKIMVFAQITMHDLDVSIQDYPIDKVVVSVQNRAITFGQRIDMFGGLHRLIFLRLREK